MMPHAVATPSLLQQQAKRFTLADGKGKTRLVYFPQAPVPGPVRPLEGPQVEYDGPEGQFTFRGEDVTQLPSRLGLLITVTLQPDVDTGQLDCTLVLPRVYLAGKKGQSFEAIAIKAKSKGHVVDHAGADLTYEAVPLSGVAEGVIIPV